jgi:C1A family cysteine protease
MASKSRKSSSNQGTAPQAGLAAELSLTSTPDPRCKDPNFPCYPTARPPLRVVAYHGTDGREFPAAPMVPGLSKPSERKTKRYGWVPDLPDARDHMYAAPMMLSLPPQWDLRDHDPFPAVYDQGQLGSCTANALAAAVQFERMRQKLAAADEIPSRLFIYYNERVIEGTIPNDSGAQLRDGIKTLVHYGSCFEGNGQGQWPYDIAKFATTPPPECNQMALKDRVIGYSRLSQVVDQMRGCLASGYPFVAGFTAYESFESQGATSGVVPLPGAHEKTIGGHAVLVIGYNDATQQFTIRNSWGNQWGKDGYGLMPYTYLTNDNLAGDFWTIRLISPPTPDASTPDGSIPT